jgi:uncharacterized protein (DUF433 family)
MTPAGGLSQRIVTDPNVCGGKACIKGTRIPIVVILEGMAEGMSPEQLMDHYPHLTMEDIRAALAYAADLAQENIWKLAV